MISFDYSDRLISTFIQLNYLILVGQYIKDGKVECSIPLIDIEIESDDYYTGLAVGFFRWQRLYINRSTGQISSEKIKVVSEHLLHVTKVKVLDHDVNIFKKLFAIIKSKIEVN